MRDDAGIKNDLRERVWRQLDALHRIGLPDTSIQEHTGVTAQNIGRFRKEKRGLGPGNLAAIDKWASELQVGATPEPRKGDPWALPITRLSALLDTLRDPAIPDPDKARAFSFEIGYLSTIIKAALKETGHDV